MLAANCDNYISVVILMSYLVNLYRSGAHFNFFYFIHNRNRELMITFIDQFKAIELLLIYMCAKFNYVRLMTSISFGLPGRL